MGRLDVDCDCSDASALKGLAALLPRQAVVVISPLLRTRQTLAAIAAAGGTCADPLVEADFIEQSFGAVGGARLGADAGARPRLLCQVLDRPDAECAARRRELRDPDRAHGGRQSNDFRRGSPAAIFVCVSHGGTIRAACAHALDLTTRRRDGDRRRQSVDHPPRSHQRRTALRHRRLVARASAQCAGALDPADRPCARVVTACRDREVRCAGRIPARPALPPQL